MGGKQVKNPGENKNPGRDKKQDKKRGKKIGVKPSIVIWRKKRMGSRWKRNAVIGTMVVLVGAAEFILLFIKMRMH